MENESGFEIGWNSSRATITAIGTTEASIVFRGVSETPGSWVRLLIGSGVTTDSGLRFAEVGHAGGATGTAASLNLPNEIAVSDCRFYESWGFELLKTANIATDYTQNNGFSSVTSQAPSPLQDTPQPDP